MSLPTMPGRCQDSSRTGSSNERPEAKRVVIKIGTNTICKDDGTVDSSYLEDVARQVVQLEKKGVQCIIVTSGAIGSGAAELGLRTHARTWPESRPAPPWARRSS